MSQVFPLLRWKYARKLGNKLTPSCYLLSDWQLSATLLLAQGIRKTLPLLLIGLLLVRVLQLPYLNTSELTKKKITNLGGLAARERDIR